MKWKVHIDTQVHNEMYNCKNIILREIKRISGIVCNIYTLTPEK
jgi:hypothetical protein